jgi:hypothetical protein
MNNQKLALLFLLLMPVILSSCFLYQELPVEYDYSYKGKFNKYNTFSIQDLEANATQEYGYLIDNSILSHMRLHGYQLDHKKPDLLITYSIFEDSLTLRGYHQPELNQWLKRTKRQQTYYSKKIELYEGTLFIQIYDRKQDEPVWQGYATDKFGKIIFSSDKQVRNAVKSVLNKYHIFSEQFAKNEEELLNQKIY